MIWARGVFADDEAELMIMPLKPVNITSAADIIKKERIS
jgi:hypothetical protein